MKLSRRDFLKYSAGTAVSAASGLVFPGIVNANTPWGVLPASVGDLPKYKVLDIFCPGGVSQWENFWVSQDGAGGGLKSLVLAGGNGNLNWRGLGEQVANLNWNACSGGSASTAETVEFGVDANGTPVSWGPATSPLWRPDIFSRCRMLVTKHSDDLHAFAGYRTLTGRRFGSPRGASLGASIQRHYQSLADQQDIPYSYVFAPKHLGKEYVLTNSTLIGQHPGPSRPLGLKVGNAIGDLLKRTGISPQADDILKALGGQYNDLLRWQGGDRVRAPNFDGYDSAIDYLLNSNQLDGLLGGDALVAGTDFPCANDLSHSFEALENPTRRSLELAANMLNNGARHVTVIDGGMHSSDSDSPSNGYLRDSSTPYDGHHRDGEQSVVEMTSIHLFNLLQGLASIIDNSPGSGDVGSKIATGPVTPKINLDYVLVRILTEFGRDPDPSVGSPGDFQSSGRDHYPAATVAVMIGGPVSSRAIQGGIALDGGNLNSAIATNALSPTDVYAGGLLAAGVDPLASDNLTNGDDFSAEINPGGNAYADEIRTNVKQKVLGVNNQINSVFTFG